ESTIANMYRLRRDAGLIEGDTSRWNESRKQGVDFVGHGNEPGWLLEIDHEKNIIFETLPSQEVSISAPAPKPVVSGNTTRYSVQTSTGELLVEVVKSNCTDTMSGEVSAYSVKITANGATYNGCGLFLNAGE